MSAASTVHSSLQTAQLDQIAADFRGRIGFYIEDLKSGATRHYNRNRCFPTASVCKIPVMIELFRQVEEGCLSLDERHRLHSEISTHGSGLLSLLRDEPELTLHDYCRLMICVSDNMATDQLIEIVGPKSTNAMLDALGFPDTRTSVTLGRYHYRMYGMDDEPCNRENDRVLAERSRMRGVDHDCLSFHDSLENNVSTPQDMASILKQLYYAQMVSPGASAAMLDMLRGGRDRRMIPRHLDRELPIAHKYGSSGRIKGDVGIVYLPTGPLIISAFALASDDDAAGDEAIAEISRLAVKAISPASVSD